MIRIAPVIGFALCCMLAAAPVFAQQEMDVDAAFEQARQQAADGQWERARSLSREILQVAPDYHEVRIFLARVHGWDRQFRDARRELAIVLQDDPDNMQAIATRADIELWSGNFNTAEPFARRVADQQPDDPDAQFRHALVTTELKRYSQALSRLDRVDEISPEREDARQLRLRIEQDERRTMVAVGLLRDDFSNNIASWERLYGEVHRATSRGPVIARVNVAHRFSRTNVQAELDAYPRFSSKWYGYLNVGISSSTLFPDVRTGAELYRAFPKGFEGSAGFRYLSFTNDDVFIFTGSISHYWRSWFFSARPFITPQSAGTSAALNLLARRFHGHPDRYTTLLGGFGFSADENRLIDSGAQDRFQRSQFIGLRGNYLIPNTHVQLFGEIKYTRQEIPPFSGFTDILTLETGFRYRF
ncbi:MAG: YaiO family outer membrane beta-barrel protein [Balneolaceae bacterium]